MSSDNQPDCSDLISLLLRAVSGASQGSGCGCHAQQAHQEKTTEDKAYQQALIRFNETASQVAADKLQAAQERQAERQMIAMKQLATAVSG